MPIRRRTSTGSTPSPCRSTPLKHTVPVVTAPGINSFIRLKQRSSVVLPHPEGPMMETTRPRGMDSETSLRAVLLPKRTDSPSADRAAVSGPVPDAEMFTA